MGKLSNTVDFSYFQLFMSYEICRFLKGVINTGFGKLWAITSLSCGSRSKRRAVTFKQGENDGG